MLWHARGVFVVAFAVLLWSVHYGAQRVFPEWYGQSGVAASEGSDPEHISGQSRPQYEVSDIVQAHLFGTVDEPAQDKAVQAPETKLQLQLTGLIASSDNQLARAMIGVNGRVRSYTVGQAIDGTDAVIHAVEKHRVLLNRGGALESLGLKRQSLFGDGNPPRIDNRGLPPDATGAAETGSGQQVSEFRGKVNNGQMKQPF